MSELPHLDRRALFGTVAAALVTSSSRGWAAAPDVAASWLAYDSRLRGLLRAPPGERFQPEVEDGLLEESNRFRAAHGAGALLPNAGLERAARAAAADMAHRGFFDHDSPEGHGPSDRVGLLARDLCGGAGENIAYQEGGRSPPTARSFFEQWRDSPGHRENLLRPSFTHVGHGVIGVRNRTYAAAVFAAEQMRLGAEAPLRLRDGRGLEEALASADPRLDRFAISAPDGSGATPALRLGEASEPPPGVWRLRPYLPAGRNRYVVLWGPIFVAG